MTTISDNSANSPNAIAIIGWSGRFPGANSIDQYWQNLLDGKDCVTELPVEACIAAGLTRQQCEHPAHRRRVGLIDGMDAFDAEYFGLYRMETEAMDPQHRLALECAAEALDDAGIDPGQYKGVLGIFAGETDSSYLRHNLASHPARLAALGPLKAMAGTSNAFLATTLAYKLNLRGPAISLQTACSTGAVTVHMAIQSLLSGECDMTLAGAASIDVNQAQGYMYTEGGILSRDGRCRPFDAAASGTVPGNGVGMLVLCRLADALEQGYPVYATIRGSAVNNDGAQKVGFAAPSVQGQARVVAEALMVADVTAASISYVEAHGTATALGDPIELDALTRVFRREAVAVGSVGIGSVKSNLGHLDTAAGIASIIKVALALKHQVIPRTLHFEQAHPAIGLEQGPFRVVTHNQPWQQLPRRAGVSAFGVGGTNVHLILEEAPPLQQRPAQPAGGTHIIPLSARTDTALARMLVNLADRLEREPGIALADVALTLQVGRKPLPVRYALACDTVTQAIAQLRAAAPADFAKAGENPAVAFMFSGQGAQVLYMGHGLYQSAPVFRQTLDQCASLVRQYADVDLIGMLYPSEAGAEAAGQRLARTRFAQPALFAVSYALAQTWQAAGVMPTQMIGHSIGELVAACLAGTFSLADALYLVCERAAAMDECETAGSMLSVSAPATEMARFCGPEVALAVDNAPQRCVLSGSTAQIEAIRLTLAGEGIPAALLHTSHAFHSPLMAAAQRRFAAALQRVSRHAPAKPWISNRTGLPIDSAAAQTDQYWLDHMMQTVHFGAGIRYLRSVGMTTFLELGPGQSLCKLAAQNAGANSGANSGANPIVTLSSLTQGGLTELACFQASAAACWRLGVPLKWAGLPGNVNGHGHDTARRVSLPSYPFERQSYWLDAIAPEAVAAVAATSAQSAKQPDAAAQPNQSAYGMAVHKTKHVHEWFYLHSWQRTLPARLLERIDPAAYAGVWLVIHEPTGLSKALAARLAGLGQQVVSVVPGQRNSVSTVTQTEQPGQSVHYEIDLARADSCDWLLAELHQRALTPTNVVHMALTSAHGMPMDQATAAAHGLVSLFHLVQAFETRKVRTLVNFSVFASCALDVGGSDPVDPMRAAAAGLCKSLPQDFKHMTAQFIDIGELPPPDTPQAANLVDLLQDELCAIPYDQLIAWRGRTRWVRSYPRFALDGTPATVAANAEADADAQVRHHVILADTPLVVRTLIRSLTLPGRALVRLSVLVPSGQIAADQLLALQNEFAALPVAIMAAPLASSADLRLFKQESERQFGPVRGVFCRLFAFDDLRAFVHQVSPLAVQQRILAVEAGLDVVKEVFGTPQVDFVLFFSSIITALAGIGASAIFAAYTALDEQVGRIAAQHNLPWVALDGEGWFEQDLLPGGITAAGVSAVDNPGLMTLEELAQVIDHTLAIPAQALSRLIATPMDIPAREEWVRRNILKHNRKVSAAPHAGLAGTSVTTGTGASQGAAAARPVVFAAPASGAAPATPPLAGSTQARLAAIIKDLTGCEVRDERQMLFETGWDSLVVLQVFPRIRAEFHLDVPIRSLLEVGTLGELADLIENRQPDPVGVDQSARFDVSSAAELVTMLLGKLRVLSDQAVADQLAAVDQHHVFGANTW
jgi:acyl transferase domain-containing protein/acyl carrier protein